MTEQQIKPEDVRVGDRIRIEWMADDILRAETGTVAEIDMDGDFRSQAGWLIGTAYIKERINRGEQITITLLDRPKPKLPTEVGSVIHVSECRGVECDTLAMLCEEFCEDKLWRTARWVGGYRYHESRHITACEPRNVVEVQE